MKKLFSILTILSLSFTAASATEQDVVDRSATIVSEFRHMPEKGIPSRIIRHARGLAIISVVRAEFILHDRSAGNLLYKHAAASSA